MKTEYPASWDDTGAECACPHACIEKTLRKKRDRSGNCKLVFPFHYGSESESYAFYRVPKALFESEVFRPLSTDAKLLYGLLNDRMDLSRKNGWVDEEGKVYIYFTRQSVMEALTVATKRPGSCLLSLMIRTGSG